MSALTWYNKNWPKVGIVGSAALAGALAWGGDRMSRTQAFAVANLATLGAHQYEEHVYPGYFGGVFNRYLRNSDSPDNYPVDARTAMIINTVMAYPFTAAPALFPNNKWLALGNALFGFTQTLGHCVAIPAKSKVPYVPGAVTALFIYAPLGAAWLREQARTNGPYTRADIAKGIACTLGFAVVGLALPQKLLADKNSPYRAQPYQVNIPEWNHMGTRPAPLPTATEDQA